MVGKDDGRLRRWEVLLIYYSDIFVEQMMQVADQEPDKWVHVKHNSFKYL